MVEIIRFPYSFYSKEGHEEVIEWVKRMGFESAKGYPSEGLDTLEYQRQRAINKLARHMALVLQEKSWKDKITDNGKPGWKGIRVTDMVHKLTEEFAEVIVLCSRKFEKNEMQREVVDIANVCMMIYDLLDD